MNPVPASPVIGSGAPITYGIVTWPNPDPTKAHGENTVTEWTLYLAAP